MTLLVDVPRAVEERLVRAAAACDMEPWALAAMLIQRGLPESKGEALAALMDDWLAEDATDDDDELTRRDAEWNEHRTNLNANRAATGERPLFV